MRKSRIAAIALVSAGMFAVSAMWGADAAAQSESGIVRENTLIVGRISSDPRKTVPRLEGFAEYLREHLAGAGIAATATVVAQSPKAMVLLFEDGAVDLISETVLTALFLEENAPADLFLQERKDGAERYRSVIFARIEANIAGVEDLRGRRIAFEDRGSTTAFLIPLGIFRARGIPAVELRSPHDPVPAGSVGYVFARNELNISMWVARGLVDAGAFSDIDWATQNRNPDPAWRQMRIIHTSEPMLRSVVLVRRGLRPTVRARLEDVLLTMADDPAAAGVRRRYYHVGGYGCIDGQAAVHLADARAIYSLVKDEIVP